MGRTPDGLTLYLGDYGINAIQVWTNADPTTASIDEEQRHQLLPVDMHYIKHIQIPLTLRLRYSMRLEALVVTQKLRSSILWRVLVNTLVDAWYYLGSHELHGMEEITEIFKCPQVHISTNSHLQGFHSRKQLLF